MYYHIDPEFMEYFENLSQVFLYITDECNLRCMHCLYKPNLTFHLKEKEIPLNKALALTSDFADMGASKLTVMGGEPTLYGNSQGHKPLSTVISESKDLGYEYIRIDTNGMFSQSLLLDAGFKKLDEITFSLDGHAPKLNDSIRGEGCFEKCVPNIKKAVELGYNVNITCCIHKRLLERDIDGNLLIDSMIEFAEELGVKRINFHDLFKTGIPRDTWTGDFDPSLQEWMYIYEEIQANITNGKYKIPVRMPQCFVTKEEFEKNPEYYGYCSAKLGERVLVHPNGIIRVCSLMIGTPYGVARFYDDKITWDRSLTNELRDHRLDVLTPCTNQSKQSSFGNLAPLCVSFKPSQEEYVWKERIHWESRRKKIIIEA